jgi:hypothetical protein
MRQKNDNYISFSKCKSKYMLNKNDLHNTKIIYLKNPNNAKTYYLFEDIRKIVVTKYGNALRFGEKVSMRVEKQKLIKRKKEDEVNKKREELVRVLSSFKLPLKSYGDHYEYINTGKTTIEEIIENERIKIEEKDKRVQKIADELEKYGIIYNEHNKHCYNYVNKIGFKKLDDIVTDIVLEKCGELNILT